MSRRSANAPRRRSLLTLAACCMACCWTHGVARGEATLLDFIDGAEPPVATEQDAAELDAPSPLAGDRALQEPVVEAESLPTGNYAMDFNAPYGAGPEDQPSQTPGSMPIGWISGPYLRYGVDFVVGEGLLEGGQKLGWGINGGFRQPLAPGLAPGRMFFDFGGGYLSAVGNTHRIVAGEETNIVGSPDPKTIPGAYSVNLTEVKRASIQTALGWYWGDAVDRRGEDPQLRFATRFGGRFGSVRGRFHEERIKDPTTPLRQLKSTYLNTDTFGGLLLGTEAVLLKRSYGTCNVLWTADVEFANDWIEFGGFDSGSLGTASLMTGFMLSR
jgi:hypothetical protein